jgi:hypothetical protein
MVKKGVSVFQVAEMLQAGDPAVVKTLSVKFTVGGRAEKVSGQDPDIINLDSFRPVAERAAEVHCDAAGQLSIEARQLGAYELKTASGKVLRTQVASLAPPLQITGPWDVQFPPNWGAPEHMTFYNLISWSDHPNAGVKYFSGTATYAKMVNVPANLLADEGEVYLDLAAVAVMAQVKPNGHDLGIIWKAPYRLNVTGQLYAGPNDLEIRVVNLWINRLFGDEQLPKDSQRNNDGTLKEWPAWLEQGLPSPTGRFTFTSWRLWKKGDVLVQSGLLGPVTLAASRKVILTSQ